MCPVQGKNVARNLDWDIYDMLQLALSAPINSWYVSYTTARKKYIQPTALVVNQQLSTLTMKRKIITDSRNLSYQKYEISTHLSI